MFWKSFSYQIKLLIRDPLTVFWILIFPVVLCTFFNLSFAKILSTESFEKIPVCLVSSANAETDDEELKTILEDSGLFECSYTTDENEAGKKLKDRKIDGYFTIDDKLSLVVNREGMNETILLEFADMYNQLSQAAGEAAKDIMEVNPAALAAFAEEAEAILSSDESLVQDEMPGKGANILVIYYYAAIAMTCLFSAFGGVDAVLRIQANQSVVAARMNITPAHKMKLFLSSLLANMAFHYTSMTILLLYLRFVLKLDFGSDLKLIILVVLVGSLMGSMFGTFVGIVTRKGYKYKEVTVQVFCILGGFLAGMMDTGIKYTIHSVAPVVEYINPASLICDSLYALYYYDTYEMVYRNICILFIFALVFGIGSFLVLRRQKYASI